MSFIRCVASRRVNLIVGELGEWHVLSGPAASCKSLSVAEQFIRLRALTRRVRDEDSWPAHTCLLVTLIRQVCFHLRRSSLVMVVVMAVRIRRR